MLNIFFYIQGDKLYMAVSFWLSYKRDVSTVQHYTVAYISVTFQSTRLCLMLSEQVVWQISKLINIIFFDFDKAFAYNSLFKFLFNKSIFFGSGMKQNHECYWLLPSPTLAWCLTISYFIQISMSGFPDQLITRWRNIVEEQRRQKRAQLKTGFYAR